MIQRYSPDELRQLDRINWQQPLSEWAYELGIAGAWMAVPNRMGWGSTTLRDLAKKHDGALTNMDPATDWVAADNCPGAFGALSFDPVDDRVVISSEPPVSVPFWFAGLVRVASTGVFTRLAHLRADAQRFAGAWFQVNSGGTFGVGFGDNSGTAVSARRSIDSVSTVSAGQWYFLAGTMASATTGKLWVDGSDAGLSASGTGSGLVLSTGGSYIGAFALNNQLYTGAKDIASLMFGLGELTDSSVASLYEESLRGYPRLLRRIPTRRYFFAAGGGGATGAAAITLADAILSSAASVELSATASATLDDATLSGTGALAINGSVSAALADATVSSAASLQVSGATSTTLEDATLSSAGTSGSTGSLSVTLEDCTTASAAELPINGTQAGTLEDATTSAAGTLAIDGSVSATLGDATLSASGTGATTTDGTVSATLGDCTLSASGTLTLEGVVSAALEAASLSSAGTLAIEGTAANTLEPVTLAATGTEQVTSAGYILIRNATLRTGRATATLKTGRATATLVS